VIIVIAIIAFLLLLINGAALTFTLWPEWREPSAKWLRYRLPEIVRHYRTKLVCVLFHRRQWRDWLPDGWRRCGKCRRSWFKPTTGALTA
jgi:hypothetical protein